MNTLKPLNHTGSIQLETERLILRPTCIDDAQMMFTNWATDPEVTRYLAWEPHANITVTREVLAAWDKENERLDHYHWGLVLKENGQLIGTGGSLGIKERHQSTELGYCMGRAYWGLGLMSEAVAAMIEHFLHTVGLNRVTARHIVANTASGRVMQKCGMTFEGIQRKVHYSARHGFIDLASYAILRDDIPLKEV